MIWKTVIGEQNLEVCQKTGNKNDNCCCCCFKAQFHKWFTLLSEAYQHFRQKAEKFILKSVRLKFFRSNLPNASRHLDTATLLYCALQRKAWSHFFGDNGGCFRVRPGRRTVELQGYVEIWSSVPQYHIIDLGFRTTQNKGGALNCRNGSSKTYTSHQVQNSCSCTLQSKSDKDVICWLPWLGFGWSSRRCYLLKWNPRTWHQICHWNRLW